MKKIFLPISIFSAFIMMGCSGEKGSSNESVSENITIEDTTANNNTESEETDANTGATQVMPPVSFNGVIIMPPKMSSTLTLTMGGSIHEISVFEGDYVKKGEIIASLKNPDFILLQQEFLTANAQTEFLEKEYKRQEKLVSEEAASEKKFEQSKAEYLSMKSQLEASKAKLTLLDVDTDELLKNGIKTYLEVKAPISGYVTNMNVNLGTYVGEGESVCKIINKSEIMLLLTAYEKDLAHLNIGDNLTFTVNGIKDTTFNAEITSIDQTVNTENRSINVYAKVKETNKLFRPGMYVNAQLNKNM